MADTASARTTAATEERAEAASLVAAMPALLVEARRIATTIVAGWHGRRRAGPGETFWQFRPFISGETASVVDWRRSAHDDHLYVREKEWEAAHTLWLAPDLSGSMAFRSRLSPADKRSRAIVLSLAMAELLARGGERVGLLGYGPPFLSRNASEKIAHAIAVSPPLTPEISPLRRHSEVVILSDFLDPLENILEQLDAIAHVGARAHLVQILDPIEETFPFTGRTELADPETGFRHVVGRAEHIRSAYRRLLDERRARLRSFTGRMNWTFLVHRTDRPPIEPLALLYARLASREPVAGNGRAA